MSLHRQGELGKEIESLWTQIRKKEQEIEKRKELATKMMESSVVVQKLQQKESKIESKIEGHRTELQRKRDHYEAEIKKAEEKFETYRAYCLRQIETAEEKAEASIKLLEQEQQQLQSGMSVAEDKALKKLEIELSQLQERMTTTQQTLEKESNAYSEYKRKEQLAQLQMEEYQQRLKDQIAKEEAIQQQQIRQAEEERKKEERRKRTQEEINDIMKRAGCSYEQAVSMWQSRTYPTGNQVVNRDEEERKRIIARMRELKDKYKTTEFLPVLRALDIEFQKKVVRLEEPDLDKFLKEYKPQIEALTKFENDPLALNEEYEEKFSDLNLDEQLECIKIKDKLKRHKFIDKTLKSRVVKTRVDKINEQHGCV